MKSVLRILSLTLLAAGCGGSDERVAHQPTQGPSPPPGTDPKTGLAPAKEGGDAPEVSRGMGLPGGYVLLWPRVNTKGDKAAAEGVAQKVQAKLRDMIKQIAPGADLDVRPSPERVCKSPGGCKSASVGAIVHHDGQNGCAVIAVVSGPGESPQTLVPWVADMRLKSTTAPFHSPPESQVVLEDLEACDQIDTLFGKHAAAVEGAIRSAGGK